MTVAILDVQYDDVGGARGAVLVASSITDAESIEEHVVDIASVAPYKPGAFFRRELPCLQAALSKLARAPALVVIDGYVWLDDAGTEGLGASLRAIGGTNVIGIAKTAYRGATFAEPVLRGEFARRSSSPRSASRRKRRPRASRACTDCIACRRSCDVSISSRAGSSRRGLDRLLLVALVRGFQPVVREIGRTRSRRRRAWRARSLPRTPRSGPLRSPRVPHA
ncbi:MAG: endonuclease V [Polyangiaceae bacterium]